MTRPEIEFHPEAIKEAANARRWYEERSSLAAAGFMVELDRAIEKVAVSPDGWSPYLHGTRYVPLHRYPYLVVFRHSESTTRIIAVAHAIRRPGYWKDR